MCARSAYPLFWLTTTNPVCSPESTLAAAVGATTYLGKVVSSGAQPALPYGQSLRYHGGKDF